MRSGVYQTKLGLWVMVSRGGRGAENSWMPRTNDFVMYCKIQDEFGWSSDRAWQQKKLDAFAERNGLEEVSLERVRQTYNRWTYERGNR